MRIPAVILTLNLVLFAFSGCLAFLEDEPEEEEKVPDTAEADTPGSSGDGNGTQENGTVEEPGPEPARLNGTVVLGNETVAGANVSLGPVEADGPELATTTSDDDGSFHFEGLAPGAYTLTVNATCCAENVTELELQEGEAADVEIQLESLEAAPEGGEATGGATGALYVLSNRASFELTSDDHAQIELIPESNDPLAQQGESYSLRLYLPDGEEENHDAVNGEPIVTEAVMTGTYEITVWPVLAGAIEYTIDWCAYSSTHCGDA